MRTLAILLALLTAASVQSGDDWLTWSAERAAGIGMAAYVRGRVGGLFDTRILKTERSYNYKLAATWLTPNVIRANARLVQLRDRLSADQARALVTEAEAAGDTVVLVEIDPREGSGVIPLDWGAFLQPATSGDTGRAVRGENRPQLSSAKALAGATRRDYAYDRFWVVFPLKDADGNRLFPPDAREAELIVRIHDREGRVKWPIPDGMREQ